MTDRELYAKMQREARSLPEGFEERNDLLLQQLTHQERKVNVKKVILIALAATLLLGSIAYAATQIDLSTVIFGHETATSQQVDYVNNSTQYATITRVATGGSKRGDYASSDLEELSLADAYIESITAFVDGARLVIGFTKTEAGQPWELSCDGFFVNNLPVAGGLKTRNGIYSLDTELPTELLGQDLTITLPLHCYRENQAQEYQYITCTMAKNNVQFTPEVSVTVSDQMKLTLMKGTLSPLGLRVPLKIERGDAVNDYGGYSCYVGGEEVMDAWQGGTEEADDVIELSVEKIPQAIEIRVAWQEIEDNNVYDCSGAVQFDLTLGTATVSDATQTFAYQQPIQHARTVVSSDMVTFDLDATPRVYTFKPRMMDMAQLMTISEDVMTKEIIDTLICVDESATARSYRSDTNDIKAHVYYDPATGKLNIMGPGAVDENWLGAVDAPNCSLTMADAKQKAEIFMQRFGYTHEMLRVERVEAFVANKRGGYFIYLNVLDDQMPRYVNREGYVSTEWRLMINERGVCQVTGRLVTVEASAATTDAISLEAAREKAEEAITSGEIWNIDREGKLVTVRAVSYVPNMYVWTDEAHSTPVWEFDFAEAGSEWVNQICVNRLTGELFDPNERPAVKMEGV